jgi:3-hydroxybutyryl-CoA dehydratase
MSFNTGDRFEEKFSVTNAVYDGFISVFHDRNVLHTDESFAISRGFKGRVMHGNILNGFLSFFIGECLPVKEVIIHSQEIQYKNAVYLNDELFFDAEVTGVFESVGAAEFKFSFKNDAGKVLAKGKFQIGLLK